MVISTAGESGPCSAWLSRSTATTNGSAASSATIRISVGPANRSIPTSPNSCRLASATYALPGPASRSTLPIVSVPMAIAATAWMPPSRKISSAPARCRAATVAAGISPRIGGVQAVTRSTPATLAVTTVMCAEATSG